MIAIPSTRKNFYYLEYKRKFLYGESIDKIKEVIQFIRNNITFYYEDEELKELRWTLATKLIKQYIQELLKDLKFYLFITDKIEYTVTAIADNLHGELFDSNYLIEWDNYSYGIFTCFIKEEYEQKKVFTNGKQDLVLLGQLLPMLGYSEIDYSENKHEKDNYYLFLDGIRMIDVSFKNKTYRIEIIDEDCESVREVFDKPHVSLTNCILENKFYHINDEYYWPLFEYNKINSYHEGDYSYYYQEKWKYI